MLNIQLGISDTLSKYLHYVMLHLLICLCNIQTVTFMILLLHIIGVNMEEMTTQQGRITLAEKGHLPLTLDNKPRFYQELELPIN